ncbi:MAG: asparagine synthase (glutamine-hydrolyzing) [Pseudomonadota bacterium]
MCAIAGWQLHPGKSMPQDVAERMALSMRHRGPDDSGRYSDAAGGIVFAHRRLSIIDLSPASHQPMVDEPTGIALTYNGELYNFRELRSELQALGHVFLSSGDTEIVLRSYIAWGTACFDRFSGMFALAIWDARTRTLHLARDATGMKPLYFMQGDEGFVFASELKAFSQWPSFQPALNPHAVQQYLEFGYVFDTAQTMLQGIQKLEPGQRLEVREGEIRATASWYVPPVAPREGQDEQCRVGELGELLNEVVTQHLIADVPVGLLLSGGLDSSVIAALAAKRGPLQTVSMGFTGGGVDERVHARQVSRHIGSEHVDVLISPEEVMAEISGGAWVFDDLFADWGTVTTRLLYRRCREKGLKVVLVGEGADELFGGYEVFDAPARMGFWNTFKLYQRYSGRRHGRLFGEFRAIMHEYLDRSGGDAFSAIRLFEARRQLPNQYVMKVDKASMAESVEARTPYLDRRVADFAFGTPREWLSRNGENKYLLRALARRENLLPPHVCSRPKFGAPLDAGWMDNNAALRTFARARILDSGSQTSRLGLRSAMQAYFDEGRGGYAFPAALSIFRNIAWRLLLLEMWSTSYLTPTANRAGTGP